jgi:tetratricopeptide (TPR) repeat protein
MNWRTLAVGALVTLVVSVIAGVIVWLITKPEPIAEKLQYSIENAATFTADKTKISFITIKLYNAGTKAARDFRLVADFKSVVEIRERQISISSGRAASYSVSANDNKSLEITLPTLVVGEVLTASLLVSGTGEIIPSVSARSAETVATEKAQALTPAPDEVKNKTIYILIVLFAALFTQTALFYFLRFSRRWLLFQGRNLNNTAFTLLQSGLVQVAGRLLEKSIDEGSTNATVLANYAVSKSLSGDKETAKKLFAAAEWWSSDKWDQTNIQYGNAVVAAKESDFELAGEHLRKALALKKNMVRDYCKLSVYIKEAASANETIRKLVEGAQ